MRPPLSIVALGIGALAQLSSGGTGDASVAIRTFQFTPDTLHVQAHTRVIWKNHDDIEHTIASGTPGEPEGVFNGVVGKPGKPGASYATVLETPGTYRYFCDRHPFMTGTIIVTRRGDLQ